jgi:hypothetical protein
LPKRRRLKKREKSHISHCVYDSAWEATEAYRLEKNPHVTAFAKNDHLGFGVLYTFKEYGEWCGDISFNVADVEGIIAKHRGA